MKQHIQQKDYLSLSKEVRTQLVQIFTIHKSEGVRVVNNEVVSDGSSQQDLIDAITIGKMIEYLGKDWKKVDNDKLFDDLFNKVIAKNGTNKGTEGKSIETKGNSPQSPQPVSPAK